MKSFRIISLLFLMLVVASNLEAQIRTNKKLPSQKTETLDLKDVNKKINQAQVQNVQLPHDYFKLLKLGSSTEKEGERELTIVNDNFPELNKTTVTKGATTSSGDEVCSKERIKVEVKTRDFKAFSMNDRPDWLKPGIIMRARSFIDGSSTIEEQYDRTPITLATNLRGASTTIVTVANPRKKSEITAAENRLISQNASAVPAQMYFTYHEIHSLEEMGFKLTGKYSAGLGAFSASLGIDYGNSKDNYYYMIEFHQNMFSIEVDGLQTNQVFTDPSVPVNEYVYLSKVNYGRRGFIVFKSAKSIDQLDVRFNAKSSGIITNGELKTAYNKLKTNSEVEIEAFFYGGSTQGAVSTITNSIKNGSPSDIVEYISSRPFDHKLALPIGFELKNLENARVGLDNNFEQTVKTCIPKRDFKLKVTLTDIQCINGRDGGSDNPDDYAIQQYIVFKTLGKEKKYSLRDINKFPDVIDNFQNSSPVINPLAYGDTKHQIPVRQNPNINQRNRNMINNSLVFNIRFDEYNDPNVSFKIFTWLKEYSSTALGNNDDKLLANNEVISVKIKDVLDILAGIKSLREETPFFDTSIAANTKFHNFGSGYLMLTQLQSTDNLILEGPIRVGSPGQKAAVWVQFELQ
ncbi:MAG: thiol-activated cytolysin family protein [Draconibacterium sp.]